MAKKTKRKLTLAQLSTLKKGRAKLKLRIRKKGVAIVKSKKGILVVAGRSRVFSLPGGGAERGESKKQATIRELKEETNLDSKGSRFLFDVQGRVWKDFKGRPVKNSTKVFLVKTHGTAMPRNEIKNIAHWKPGSRLKVSPGTRSLLDRYSQERKRMQKR